MTNKTTTALCNLLLRRSCLVQIRRREYKRQEQPRRQISCASSSVVTSVSETVKRQGFCICPHPLLSESTCRALHERMPKLFAGHFETGVYPDEWHWRKGISKDEGVTREMCNVWKSDRLIASIILQQSLGRLVCEVMHWPSVRIAQDDLIWKPPYVYGDVPLSVDDPLVQGDQNNSVVGFHQDSAYISNQFEPRDNNSVTVWIALDDVDKETGCLQYVPGSHLWTTGDNDVDEPLSANASFHGGCATDYQGSLPRSDASIVSVPVSQGHALFHHQDVWHGSGPNRSTTRHRRALVGHYLRGDVQFKQQEQDSTASGSGVLPRTPWGQVSYIYGRYKRFQSDEVDESFFPILYASPGQEQERTSWIDNFINS